MIKNKIQPVKNMDALSHSARALKGRRVAFAGDEVAVEAPRARSASPNKPASSLAPVAAGVHIVDASLPGCRAAPIDAAWRSERRRHARSPVERGIVTTFIGSHKYSSCVWEHRASFILILCEGSPCGGVDSTHLRCFLSFWCVCVCLLARARGRRAPRSATPPTAAALRRSPRRTAQRSGYHRLGCGASPSSSPRS